MTRRPQRRVSRNTHATAVSLRSFRALEKRLAKLEARVKAPRCRMKRGRRPAAPAKS